MLASTICEEVWLRLLHSAYILLGLDPGTLNVAPSLS